MTTLTFTAEMAIALGLLGGLVVLLISERVRVDVAALIILVLLGLSSVVLPPLGLEPLIDQNHLFDGFASTAVISIMAVMIIGAALDKTGLMANLAKWILKVAGKTEAKIFLVLSGALGVISSFMQNVGAVALFIPVATKISKKAQIPLPRLLMPLSFCALSGGALTMVGSSPLILLNDLLLGLNPSLPENVPAMEPFSLFSVTPIGLMTLSAGVLYFLFLGKKVLPNTNATLEDLSARESMKKYFKDTYGLHGNIYEVRVPEKSRIAGKKVTDIETTERSPFILAIHHGSQFFIQPALGREIPANSSLALFSTKANIKRFVTENELQLREDLEVFSDVLDPSLAGQVEVVIPANSSLIGQTLFEIDFPINYDLSVLALYRNGETLIRGRDLISEIQSGDMLLMHAEWETLEALHTKGQKEFIVVSDYPQVEKFLPEKALYAVFFFLLSISLVIFSSLNLSVSLLIGALGMILSGVIKIDEAYKVISWHTIFLLAGLIPLGTAVGQTGVAMWMAQEIIAVMGSIPVWGWQLILSLLTIFFTLAISNVAATILLVPLAVSIAVQIGASPAIMALTVAILASNSFFLPTHQANAIIMGPGGYRVKDFMRAGSGMTLIFLIVALIGINLVF